MPPCNICTSGNLTASGLDFPKKHFTSDKMSTVDSSDLDNKMVSRAQTGVCVNVAAFSLWAGIIMHQGAPVCLCSQICVLVAMGYGRWGAWEGLSALLTFSMWLYPSWCNSVSNPWPLLGHLVAKCLIFRSVSHFILHTQRGIFNWVASQIKKIFKESIYKTLLCIWLCQYAIYSAHYKTKSQCVLCGLWRSKCFIMWV